MSMIRWDPGRDLMSLRQAMDRLMEGSFVRPSGFTLELGGGIIPVDMYQTANAIVIKAALPGIKSDEVDVSITGDTLNIKAERKEDKEIQEKDYIRKENRYGVVARSITLPVEVQPDKAEASFDNGVLTLSLPKSGKVQPQQIKIQTKPKSAE